MINEAKNRAYDRAKEWGVPVFLRHEQRPGWYAAQRIYVRWCDNCRVWTETPPAGVTERLHCKSCSDAILLSVPSGWRRELFEFGMRHFPWLTLAFIRLEGRYYNPDVRRRSD